MTLPPNAETDNNISTTVSSDGSSLTKLSNAQVFSRDPEAFTPEAIDDAIVRLTKIVQGQRKARQDAEALAALTTKIKKANKANKVKKTKASPPAGDLMGTTI